MRELVDELKKKLNISTNSDNYFMINERRFLIDKKNFQNIEKVKENFEQVSFIDGGSCSILSSSDICLGLIRIVELKIRYENSKKNKKLLKKDLFVMATIENSLLKIKTYPKSEFESLIISYDNPLFYEKNEIKIDNIINLIRRISELNTVLRSNSELIVLDGSFDSKSKFEEEKINQIQKKENIICAFSKTTRIISDKGNSIGYALTNLDNSEWIYNVDKCESVFIKLNKNSDYVFRLDVINKNEEKIPKIFNYLGSISNDAVFLGYPYYLIEVDRLARISNNEKNNLLTKVKIMFGKDWRNIKRRLNAINAHDVLDKIG